MRTASQSQHQMKGRLLLDVVVGQGPSIFQLFSGKDQTLLVWGNSFLVLDLGLDVLNGVRRLDLKGNGLSSQGLHEDLHTSPESQDKMKSRLLLDVVVREGSSILKLLASENQSLLVWRNSLLVLERNDLVSDHWLWQCFLIPGSWP